MKEENGNSYAVNEISSDNSRNEEEVRSLVEVLNDSFPDLVP